MEIDTSKFYRRSMLTAAGAAAAVAATSTVGSGSAAAAGQRAADVVVNDRSELMAVDTSARTVAYLTEPGREGIFNWREGDYSVEIAADAQQGVYIKADKVAADQGAWVRDHAGPLNIRWFGATGDGVTDDSAAIQGCFDLVAVLTGADSYTGATVYAPTGLYRMMSRAVCDIDNRPPSGTPGINLIGDGQQSTYFLADESNQDGLIKLTSNFNTEVWRVYGVGFLSALAADATTHNGIALEVNSTLGPETNGFGSHRRRSVQIENVFVGAYGPKVKDQAFGGNFEKGIYIENKWWVYLTNIYIIGDSPRNVFTNFLPPQPDPDDIPSDDDVPKYSPSGRTHAIHFKSCYSPIISEIYIQGFWSFGVQVDGRDEGVNPNDYEDFRLSDSFLVGMDVGIEINHADDLEGGVHFDRLHEPGGAISNCHINAGTYGIRLRLHRQVIIDGCYFYVPRGRGKPNYSGLPASIFLDSADEVTVIGCEFLEPGFFFDQDNASCAIRASDLVTANVVGCTFAHGGIGIRTDGSDEGSITVTSSQYVGATVEDVWATFVPSVDNAGIVAEDFVERKGGSKPGAQHVVRSSAIGVGSTVRSILRNERPDYEATPDPVLGDWQVAGRNSTGSEMKASVIRTRFYDNAEGAEKSGIDFFALAGGGGDAVKLAGFSGDVTENETNLLLGVQVDGSLTVQKVEVGETDSAGTGYRALRVQN